MLVLRKRPCGGLRREEIVGDRVVLVLAIIKIDNDCQLKWMVVSTPLVQTKSKRGWMFPKLIDSQELYSVEGSLQWGRRVKERRSDAL